MRERGLAMLEVVFSAGILFMVMLILLNLATTSIWGSKEGGERLAAEAHAQSLLEEFRGRPFASLPLGQPISCRTYIEDGTPFQATLAATAVEGLSPEILRQLEITVTWNSKRGPRQSVLSTYVTPLLR